MLVGFIVGLIAGLFAGVILMCLITIKATQEIENNKYKGVKDDITYKK